MNLSSQFRARVQAQGLKTRIWAAQLQPRVQLTFLEEQECTNRVVRWKERCGPVRIRVPVFSLSSSWAKASSSTRSIPDLSPEHGVRLAARSTSVSEADIRFGTEQ